MRLTGLLIAFGGISMLIIALVGGALLMSGVVTSEQVNGALFLLWIIAGANLIVVGSLVERWSSG